jgi:hypothetical protein
VMKLVLLHRMRITLSEQIVVTSVHELGTDQCSSEIDAVSLHGPYTLGLTAPRCFAKCLI